MARVLQVVSSKGVPYDEDKVKSFFATVMVETQNIAGFTPTGLSATCGDLFGYFTLLVGIPDGVEQEKSDQLGNILCMAMLGQYRYYDEVLEKFIMTGTGKQEVEIKLN